VLACRAAVDPRTTAPPDARELLASDAELRRRLFGYARKKTYDAMRARDVAQEAVVRVLEGRGWYRWDPTGKSLLNHLCDVVDTVVVNENKRASVNREYAMTEIIERKPDPEPSAEQRIEAIEESEREQRLVEKIMQRVAGDEIIPGMLEQQEAGIVKAPELAAVLHCSVKEIYRARERLAYHREQVLAEERKREAPRMKGHVVSP
jgi:DNA-directed RNA polymerase specialized sigma24 family protein